MLARSWLLFLLFPFSKVLLGLCSADYPKNAAVIDNINVFRPDRVFMVKLSFAKAFSQDSNFIVSLILSNNVFVVVWQFITEIHYKMSAACHHRHTRHHLAALEELTIILGHRALVPSSLK